MYSYKDGYGTPAQIVARLLELKQSAFAITDHGNVSGWAPLYPLFKDAGIKLLFGIEAYIVEDRHQKGVNTTAIQYASRKFNLVEQRQSVNSKTGKVTNRTYDPIPHITIIATCQEGIRNIRNMVAESYRTGLFAGKPRIDLELLFKYQKGCLVTTGCPTGFPTRLITRKESDKARNFIETLNKNIENLVVEIVAQPGYKPSELAAQHLYESADSFKLRTIMTGDSHFPTPEDYFSEHMLARIGTGSKMDEEAGINIPNYQFISSYDTLLDRANRMLPGHESSHKIALDNALNICDDTPSLEIKQGTPPIYATYR
jgi:DNA polymerase III subunit alpha